MTAYENVVKASASGGRSDVLRWLLSIRHHDRSYIFFMTYRLAMQHGHFDYLRQTLPNDESINFAMLYLILKEMSTYAKRLREAAEEAVVEMTDWLANYTGGLEKFDISKARKSQRRLEKLPRKFCASGSFPFLRPVGRRYTYP